VAVASPASYEPSGTRDIASATATGRSESVSQDAQVVRWVDGDTVVTTRGTVRLIGIDTPEVGRCGSAKATSRAKRLAPAGTRIDLGNPTSVSDQDKYGRLLRYVDRGSVDVGLRQIRAGAVARYDSRTGYARHPRQGRYIRADRDHRNYTCSSNTTGGGGGGGGTGGAGGNASDAPVPGTWNCPASAPIKGNQGSPEWIYHMPWNAYYDATNPEECFATEAAARAHGYRAARI
jgi:endonuclease YncB( thermonuclease family)